MASGEFKQKEIAKMINVTEKTICAWKKDDEFMKELDHLIVISIRSVAAKAFKTQIRLLDSKNDMVRYMKGKDSRRLYTTSTFTFEKGHGAKPEPEDDFFVTQWTDKGWVRGQGIFDQEPPCFYKDYKF